MSEPQDPRQAFFIGRRSDGTAVQRPLSPHLQVYDMLQVTSLLSILHRITGVLWSAGALLLVWWLAALASGEAAFALVQGFLGSFAGVILLFGLTAAAWYHTLAGIRHLAWDAGWGFSLPEVRRSGLAVVAGTVVLTLLTFAAALILW
ncbi:MAG: succinate dehydrogenase, cytochrome b556 subunit [Rhodovarius sp.]|nr:succinate dehydrogenase, cytochrome b556 subunit [Rhodovarius sp.]MDW8315812.1 succinate dehydrogenase, cytochrome b556 subunit [Rhodovarius sp.]